MTNLETKQVENAVSTLKSLLKKNGDDKLLDTPSKILLQFTVKKIPQLKNKIIKIPVPHGLKSDNMFVCLFVKDLDRTERDFTATVHHYKDLLSQHGVEDISEIIPMKSLKTMYKPFEAKRKLSNSFDVHLADARIVRLLPALLGKHFYARKRHPVQVDLSASDLKRELNRALNNTRCIVNGRGSSSSAYIAHSKQSVTEIAENVIAAAQKVAMEIPGGLENIRSFHIKTEKSVAIPVYLSLDSSNNVELPENEIIADYIEAEDVTTVEEGKVRVYPDGTVEIVKDGQDSTHSKQNKSGTPKKDKRRTATKARKRKSKPDHNDEKNPKVLKEETNIERKKGGDISTKTIKPKKFTKEKVSKSLSITATKTKKLRRA